VALDRALTNIKKLEIKAAQAGMVAIQNVYRANSQGKPQEGDQLYPRQTLASIFDPSEMAVRCAVGEPDGIALKPGAKATVYLDAYPDITVSAHVEFVSPVAASALGSPIKAFTALIKLDKTDPRVMPDLSAAVIIQPQVNSTARRAEDSDCRCSMSSWLAPAPSTRTSSRDRIRAGICRIAAVSTVR